MTFLAYSPLDAAQRPPVDGLLMLRPAAHGRGAAEEMHVGCFFHNFVNLIYTSWLCIHRAALQPDPVDGGLARRPAEVDALAGAADGDVEKAHESVLAAALKQQFVELRA